MQYSHCYWKLFISLRQNKPSKALSLAELLFTDVYVYRTRQGHVLKTRISLRGRQTRVDPRAH